MIVMVNNVCLCVIFCCAYKYCVFGVLFLIIIVSMPQGLISRCILLR